MSSDRSRRRPGDAAPDAEEPQILEIVGLDEDGPPSAASDPEDVEVQFEEEPEIRGPATLPEVDREAALKDRLLRLQAEFENMRKRTERDREAMAHGAARALIARLLPVLDNLERALACRQGAEEDDPFREGVSLIHRQLLDELRKEGLTVVPSVGEAFDPAVHEAVAAEPIPGSPPNVVLEELQRGYSLRGRLLRPALVKVSLPAEGPAGATSVDEER